MTDAEAASQQLLIESASASASKPAPSAATIGANLLNAARIHPSQASPPGLPPSTRTGKLKRPRSSAQDQPRKTLARRGNLYDIIASPEKDIFSVPDSVEPESPPRKRRQQPQVQIPIRGSTRRAASIKTAHPSAGEKPRRAHSNGKDSQEETIVTGPVSRVKPDESEHSPLIESIEESPQFGGAEREDIDLVFDFLDLEKRPGQCQTELGIAIKKSCKKSCALLQSETVSSAAIIGDFNDLCNMLAQAGRDVTKEDHSAFKADMYGYVFRSLLLYLKTLYGWLESESGDITDSVNATRLLSTLTREILALKDTIASWKISVPQRYHGDRMFTEVESKLIVPLRRAGETFRVRSSQLETAQQCHNDHIKLTQKRKANADNEARRAQVAIARRKRWLHWQNLHILRMQCEPDPFRRRKLVITKLEHFEEKDANGIRFERVPLFKSRSTPPWHWVSTMPETQDWTDVEDIALLEGLQSFAGMLPGRISICRFPQKTNRKCRITCIRTDFRVLLSTRWYVTRFQRC